MTITLAWGVENLMKCVCGSSKDASVECKICGFTFCDDCSFVGQLLHRLTAYVALEEIGKSPRPKGT